MQRVTPPRSPSETTLSHGTYRSKSPGHGHGGHLALSRVLGATRALGGHGRPRFAHHAADASVRAGALRAARDSEDSVTPSLLVPSPLCPFLRGPPRDQGPTHSSPNTDGEGPQHSPSLKRAHPTTISKKRKKDLITCRGSWYHPQIICSTFSRDNPAPPRLPLSPPASQGQHQLPWGLQLRVGDPFAPQPPGTICPSPCPGWGPAGVEAHLPAPCNDPPNTQSTPGGGGIVPT